MMTPVLLSAALLLLLLPGAPSSSPGFINITITVTNSVTQSPPKTYEIDMVDRGILLGGMKRLQDLHMGFTFTYTENQDFGPYLVSVNGLAANNDDRTYWQLLVKTPDSEIVELRVGIGCYLPNEGDEIILNFNTY